MRRLSIAALATVSLFAFSHAGFAADLPVSAPIYKAAAPVYDPWSGFYAGPSIGYGTLRTGSTATPNAALVALGATDPTFGPLPGSPAANGAIAGIQFGYNMRFNRWLAGLEADLSYANLDDSTSATGAGFIGGTFHTALENRMTWFGTVRGRLGVLPADNLLLYFTGGVTFARVKTTLTATNLAGCNTGGTPPYCTPGASDTTSIGWALGGGFEYAIARAWSAKLEYLHLGFGHQSMNANDVFTPGGAVSASAKPRSDLVRLGLNYHFGR